MSTVRRLLSGLADRAQERALDAGCFRLASGFRSSRSAISNPRVWGPWWTMMMTTARRELLLALMQSASSDPRFIRVVDKAIADLSEGGCTRPQKVRRA